MTADKIIFGVIGGVLVLACIAMAIRSHIDVRRMEREHSDGD